MKVVQPPLDDLSDLGQYIQQECLDKITYRLEKSTSRSKSFSKSRLVSFIALNSKLQPFCFVVVKRDTGVSEAVPFTEYTGKYTIQYTIEGLDKLDKKVE